MKRIRVGLRLLLLLVALCAVLFTWLGARRELHRANLRWQLRDLEVYCKYSIDRIDDPNAGAMHKKYLMENEAKIATLREQLGESDQ